MRAPDAKPSSDETTGDFSPDWPPAPDAARPRTFSEYVVVHQTAGELVLEQGPIVRRTANTFWVGVIAMMLLNTVVFHYKDWMVPPSRYQGAWVRLLGLSAVVGADHVVAATVFGGLALIGGLVAWLVAVQRASHVTRFEKGDQAYWDGLGRRHQLYPGTRLSIRQSPIGWQTYSVQSRHPFRARQAWFSRRTRALARSGSRCPGQDRPADYCRPVSRLAVRTGTVPRGGSDVVSP